MAFSWFLVPLVILLNCCITLLILRLILTIYLFEIECRLGILSFNQSYQSCRNICVVYKDDFITNRTAEIWGLPFKQGKFELTDCLRSGRHFKFDENQLHVLSKELRQTTLKLVQKMTGSHVTVARHFYTMAKVLKNLTINA